MPRFAHIQNNFTSGVWSPRLIGRTDLDKYRNSLAEAENVILLPHGGAKRRPGFRFIDELKSSASAAVLIPFVFSDVQAYVIECGPSYFRFYYNKSQIVSGSPAAAVEVAHNYTADEIQELYWTQSADNLYLVQRENEPATLTRSSHTNWTLATYDLLDGPYLPVNTESTTLTLGATSGSTTITASAVTGINDGDGFQTTDVGRLIRWEDPAGNWTWMEITARTSTTVCDVTIYGADASATTATSTWRLGAFSDTTGWPETVTFFEERLCFSKDTTIYMSESGDFQSFAPSDPDGTVVGSNAITITIASDQVNLIRGMVSGQRLAVMTIGGEFTVQAASITEPVTPDNVQVSRHTTHGHERVRPIRVQNSTLFVPRHARQLREFVYQFNSDTFQAPDLTILAEHFFNSTTITDIAYQQVPDSVVWAIENDGSLYGMTFQRDQEVTAWHKHPIGGSFSGAGPVVESIATIPGSTQDELWAIIKRTINGSTVRYVEVMEDEFRPEDVNDKDGIFTVDSGLSLNTPITISGATAADPVVITAVGHGLSNGDQVWITKVKGMTELNRRYFLVANKTTDTFEITNTSGTDIDGSTYSAYTSGGEARKCETTLSGLSHLEGETVQVVADGASHPDRTVASGQITLNAARGYVHAGLYEEAKIVTQRPDGGSADGTSQGKKKKIHEIIIRFHETLGAKVGSDADNLETLNFREASHPQSDSPPLFTGDKSIAATMGWNTEGKITITQPQPLPLQVLSIIKRMVVSDG